MNTQTQNPDAAQVLKTEPVFLPALKTLLDGLLGFLYPEVCQICQEQSAGPRDGYVCAKCAGGVRQIEAPWCRRCGRPFAGNIGADFECAHCADTPDFSRARSAVRFEGVVREAILRYKYRREMWLETFLVKLLLEKAASDLRTGGWDMIIPVPLHRQKLSEREFNQAERLARHLSRATSLPLNCGWLKRIANTPSQTRLDRQQRAANVRRAFAVAKKARLQGKRVVVVDDVFTTGATTNACARVLRQAGAAEVCVWTLARGN